ncbi:MAG TPA: DNA repair protein RadC [Bacteroidota bacterium]|nr:DNA repair protein RadC [Bacteroidota bacterium]
MTMQNWPVGERPRERLMTVGPQALSDAELLAILLRTGTRGKSALDIGRALLVRTRSIRGLARVSPAELTRMEGIGPAKAVELLAALELGRRAQAGSDEQRPVLRSPEDAARRLIPFLRDREKESFVVLVLDAQNALRTLAEVSSGTLNASLVHPREVFRVAIENGAAAVLVAHNHPSGNPEPSTEDLEITRQLSESGKILGIPLHDHLIIAGNRFVSFAERGLI